MTRIVKQAKGNDGKEYRIVDDLPQWGGYYSIEVAKTSNDCTLWCKVWGCSSNLDNAQQEFERLTK